MGHLTKLLVIWPKCGSFGQNVGHSAQMWVIWPKCESFGQNMGHLAKIFVIRPKYGSFGQNLGHSAEIFVIWPKYWSFCQNIGHLAKLLVIWPKCAFAAQHWLIVIFKMSAGAQRPCDYSKMHYVFKCNFFIRAVRNLKCEKLLTCHCL